MYNNTMQTAYVGSLVTILILHVEAQIRGWIDPCIQNGKAFTFQLIQDRPYDIPIFNPFGTFSGQYKIDQNTLLD